MADKPITFHPEASAEVEAAAAWYAERSLRAARMFLAEIELALDTIGQAPSRYPMYGERTRRFLLRRFPFFVVYCETESELQILAVAHGRRRPGYWKERGMQG